MPSQPDVTVGIDLGDRHSHLCLNDTQGGEVIDVSCVAPNSINNAVNPTNERSWDLTLCHYRITMNADRGNRSGVGEGVMDLEEKGIATEPFAAVLDQLQVETMRPGLVSERRTSDMGGLYHDEHSLKDLVGSGDPLVYRAAAPVPEVSGGVPFSITTIEPGAVGEEFSMTEGQDHTSYEGEPCLGLSGKGGPVLYTGEEDRWVETGPGSAGYIPPGRAHRTVNVGSEPFRFLAAYPGAAGHDYEPVVGKGLGLRVVRNACNHKEIEESASVSNPDDA